MNSIKESPKFSWSRFRSHFSVAPIEIRVYAVFITSVSLIANGLYWIAANELTETIFIYLTGSTSMGYLFSLYWVGYLIYTKDDKSRIILIFLLAVVIVFFIFQHIKRGDIYIDNWSSRENLFLLIWNLSIPLVWIGVFLSPRIKRFCQKAE